MKPLTDFNRRARATDGLQSRCRGCSREWYEVNREQHKANVRRRNNRVRGEHMARLGRYLLEHPCVDCGEADVRVLEFDHDDPASKLNEVTRLANLSLPWWRVEAEIAKCSVRCANCHRRRTMEEGGFWRTGVERDRRAELLAATTCRLGLILPGGRAPGPQLGLW